jgi:hypothetical protein
VPPILPEGCGPLRDVEQVARPAKKHGNFVKVSTCLNARYQVIVVRSGPRRIVIDVELVGSHIDFAQPPIGVCKTCVANLLYSAAAELLL